MVSGTTVDAFIEPWSRVCADMIIGVVVLPDIGIGALLGVNVNIVGAVMTSLRCVAPEPVKAFSC